MVPCIFLLDVCNQYASDGVVVRSWWVELLGDLVVRLLSVLYIFCEYLWLLYKCGSFFSFVRRIAAFWNSKAFWTWFFDFYETNSVLVFCLIYYLRMFVNDIQVKTGDNLFFSVVRRVVTFRNSKAFWTWFFDFYETNSVWILCLIYFLRMFVNVIQAMTGDSDWV